ncbi:bifunctional NAD(P)H-hydrate repair enzyme [Bacteroidia bacterium]|nr:bifunctional NAD(P)H-hydrate repair enzyme [Bacteroidia bacterium]
MIKIFTTGQVKEIDSYTITNEPVRSIDLVERAAKAFVAEFLMRYESNKRVIVFAGQGNNGADALAIARMLSENMAFKVETYLFNPPSGKLSPDCELNKRRLLNGRKQVFSEVTGGNFYPPVLEKQDIVIDGLFGSGLSRPLEGGFAAVVKYINASGAAVISIDIPSGLFGEDNSANTSDTIIQAGLTLTFGFPKLAFFLPGPAKYVGKWKALDIGFHPKAISDASTPFRLMEEEDAVKALRPRPKFGHKGTFGHALLVAGSRGKLGAALLAARACLRSGAGLLTVHLPGCGEPVLQTAFPEAMLSLDAQDCFTTVPSLEGFSAIGIGPGLGQSPESIPALKSLLESAACPLVIDADALNLIAANPELMSLIPPRSILTPHPKEFDRLAGESANSYERLLKANAFASEHSFVIALKGAYTAVCMPDGNVSFNSTGNSGMATAGSGDVLTGIILGLLAVGYEPEAATSLGVFLHGLAGDLAAATHSEESLIASDITENLGKAFKIIES